MISSTTGPALLSCPADRPDRYAQALAAADAAVLDLEDAVGLDRKDIARDALQQTAEWRLREGTVVRVNALGTPQAERDLAMRAVPRTPACAPVNTGRERAGTASWSVLTSVSVHVSLVGIVGVALLGALLNPAQMTFVLAPAVGLLGVLQATVMQPSFPSPPARRMALLFGFGLTMTVLFECGLAALVGAVADRLALTAGVTLGG